MQKRESLFSYIMKKFSSVFIFCLTDTNTKHSLNLKQIFSFKDIYEFLTHKDA